jgi:Tfp pilus assembly protein FimV
VPGRDPTRRTTGVRRLLDRVVGARRNAKTETRSEAGDVDRERQVVALEQRVEQLEALVEGLQDSIHREAIRQDKAIEALDARTQAPELARALGKYSREHGL